MESIINNMQKKKHRILSRLAILLVVLVLFPLLPSCDDNVYNEDSLPVISFTVCLRFVSDSGTNILDSLNVKKQECFVLVSSPLEDLTFEWQNKNNDLKPNWAKPDFCIYEYPFTNTEYMAARNGTVIQALLTDISITDEGPGKNKVRDEEYTIYISSKKIFGNDTKHTIKYYVHITRKAKYEAYKCEIDGKECPISGPGYERYKMIDRVLVEFKVDKQ